MGDKARLCFVREADQLTPIFYATMGDVERIETDEEIKNSLPVYEFNNLVLHQLKYGFGVVQIFIKTFLNDKTLALDLDLSKTTIRELAIKIKEECNLDINEKIKMFIDFQTFYNGSSTLKDAGIKRKSIVRVTRFSYFYF